MTLRYRTATFLPGILLMTTRHVRGELPNKRLKLAGGDRSSGNGVLCARGHGLTSTTLAPASESTAA